MASPCLQHALCYAAHINVEIDMPWGLIFRGWVNFRELYLIPHRSCRITIFSPNWSLNPDYPIGAILRLLWFGRGFSTVRGSGCPIETSYAFTPINIHSEFHRENTRILQRMASPLDGLFP